MTLGALPMTNSLMLKCCKLMAFHWREGYAADALCVLAPV